MIAILEEAKDKWQPTYIVNQFAKVLVSIIFFKAQIKSCRKNSSKFLKLVATCLLPLPKQILEMLEILYLFRFREQGQ